jgi:hypothetical protein
MGGERLQGERSRERVAGRAMAAVAAAFLVKAVWLAFWVTPLWDVPDETGHYALVADLADGRGLPVPGRNVIPADALADWTRESSKGPYLNWVAQHPPLYHLLAAPVLSAARLITSNPRWLYRAPRLLSAISGAAALLLFFAAFREAGTDPLLSFTAAASVGFLPMYSHLASGTNHDVFLAFMSGLAALLFARFLRSGLFSDALKMAAALSLAGAVKLSAVVPAAALWLLVSLRLPTRGVKRMAQAAAVGVVAVSLPLLWTLRHWWLFGNARVHPISKEPFRLPGLLRYVRAEPVVDHTFKNFFGLIGWTGTGGGELRWFQISGAFLAIYLLLALAGSAFAALWLSRRTEGRAWRLSGAALAAAAFGFCFFWLFARGDGSEPAKRLIYSLTAAVPLLALPVAFRRQDPGAAFLSGSHIVFLIFGAAYLVNSFEAYEIYGQMRATNGRYFFAVLPFLVSAFMLAGAGLLGRGAWRDRLLLAVLSALFVNETFFFLVKVIPFYSGRG